MPRHVRTTVCLVSVLAIGYLVWPQGGTGWAAAPRALTCGIAGDPDTPIVRRNVAGYVANPSEDDLSPMWLR